jgi:hypothetical protein
MAYVGEALYCMRRSAYCQQLDLAPPPPLAGLYRGVSNHRKNYDKQVNSLETLPRAGD